MWETDNRLIVSPNKINKIPENIVDISKHVLTPRVHVHQKYLQKLQSLQVRNSCLSLRCIMS